MNNKRVLICLFSFLFVIVWELVNAQFITFLEEKYLPKNDYETFTTTVIDIRKNDNNEHNKMEVLVSDYIYTADDPVWVPVDTNYDTGDTITLYKKDNQLYVLNNSSNSSLLVNILLFCSNTFLSFAPMIFFVLVLLKTVHEIIEEEKKEE